MKKNVGSIDKTIRMAVAILIVALNLINTNSGILGVISLGIAIILLLTSILGVCPIYSVIGHSSCSAKIKNG